MTTAFGEPLIKEAIPVSALHIQPSSLLDQSLPEQVSDTYCDATVPMREHPHLITSPDATVFAPSQLLPEHQSSVPSLSDSPLPASDEVLADASSMRVGLGTQLFPSLASTLQPSDTLERQLDEVANLLAQQPRLDGGPRRPMNAFLVSGLKERVNQNLRLTQRVACARYLRDGDVCKWPNAKPMF